MKGRQMDASCRWIIGGLVFTILGMAGYIVRLQMERVADLKAWVKSLREYNSILDLVGDVNENKPPTGG